MSFEEVDENRIGVKGMSQGGGISLAVAGLCSNVHAAVAFAPSYTCIRERIDANSGILGELNLFMRLHPEHTDTVWDNVAYFDALNFAGKIKAITLIGCTLSDPICLPKYVYSAYRALNCNKEIFYAPFAPHIVTPAMGQKKLQFFIDKL